MSEEQVCTRRPNKQLQYVTAALDPTVGQCMEQLEQTWLRNLPCEALTRRRRMERGYEEHPTSPPRKLR